MFDPRNALIALREKHAGLMDALEKNAVSTHWIHKTLTKAKPTTARKAKFINKMTAIGHKTQDKLDKIPRYSGPMRLSTNPKRVNLLKDIQDKSDFAASNYLE